MALRRAGKCRFRRVLLKLSGEVLQNRDQGLSLDPKIIAGTAARLKAVLRRGAQVALVVGGGNIFRGVSGEVRGVERNTGDYMGMLATVINGLALQSAFSRLGVESRVFSGLEVQKAAEPFVLRRALRCLEDGQVLILVGGTGNPYFSTDTAAALRASELGADVLVKATKVDGVYTADPMRDPTARRYATLSYADAIGKSLKVMDAAAFALCMESRIPIVVCNFFSQGSLEGVVSGRRIGTLVGAARSELA